MGAITPAAVAAYINDNPGCDTAELMAVFGCSDGYLRKMKRQARARGLLPEDPGAAGPAAAAGPVAAGADPGAAAPAAPAGAAAPSADRVPRGRVVVGVTPGRQALRTARRDRGILWPGMVARDGTYWFCHICDQLMPAIAGTKSADWNDTGCPLHGRENVLHSDQPVADQAGAPVPAVAVAAVSADLGSGAGSAALGAVVPVVPVPVKAAFSLVDGQLVQLADRAAGVVLDAQGGVKNKAQKRPIRWPGLVPLLARLIWWVVRSVPLPVLAGLVLAGVLLGLVALQLSGVNPWLK